MKIKNTKVYGLEESIIRSGYPMDVDEPNNIDHATSEWDIQRTKKLASCKTGTGHDNFLKGIIVQFDLKYPQYFTSQLQRYSFIDIISSQSKMHKLTSIKDITDNCNKYVLSNIITITNELIELYNTNEYPCYIDDYGYIESVSTDEPFKHKINTQNEMFQYIISNLPMGYELWMGISTNYLQLKTIYQQRKNHRLDEWKIFCNWIKGLPLANELITMEK